MLVIGKLAAHYCLISAERRAAGFLIQIVAFGIFLSFAIVYHIRARKGGISAVSFHSLVAHDYTEDAPIGPLDDFTLLDVLYLLLHTRPLHLSHDRVRFWVRNAERVSTHARVLLLYAIHHQCTDRN